MTIVQLEYLVAIANYESFSAASEHCCVTQPSLSTQIKNLEAELGVILINRNVKQFQLTEVGKVVVENAKRVIADFYSIKESVNVMKNTYKGNIRVAVIPTIAPYLIPKFAPIFANEYKEVTLEVKEMTTPNIIDALEKDKIDIAILAGGFMPGNTIVEQDIYNDRFLLYCSDKNALYKKKNVNVEEIDSTQMMLLSDGHCLRTQIVDLCGIIAPKGRNLRFESGSLETLMRVVDNTNNVTIIPEMAVNTLSKEQKLRLRELNSEFAYRRISMATSKTFFKHNIHKALKELLIKLHKTEMLEREMLIK
ncbi:MAG: LysR substrate-binding domain-containing protein [Rikenellaceae bacterium]